jgi:hypothetical protein
MGLNRYSLTCYGLEQRSERQQAGIGVVSFLMPTEKLIIYWRSPWQRKEKAKNQSRNRLSKFLDGFSVKSPLRAGFFMGERTFWHQRF